MNKLRKLDLDIPDKYMIDIVIGGITDANIARMVRFAQYTNANKLYAYMNTLGDMPTEAERENVSSESRRAENWSAGCSRDSSQVASSKDYSPEKAAAGSIKSTIECFNCGLIGHVAKKCRKPRV